MVKSLVEVVLTHNLGFHPIGLLREAYVSHINTMYAVDGGEDLSMLKIGEVTNLLSAWTFMEGCDFTGAAHQEDPDSAGEDEEAELLGR
jgi:hypothetical protein